MSDRQFPILDPIDGFPRSVPWSFVQRFEHQAARNHDQSLETLARRGGLDWVELFYVVKCKPFPFGLAGKHDVAKCAREVLTQMETDLMAPWFTTKLWLLQQAAAPGGFVPNAKGTSELLKSLEADGLVRRSENDPVWIITDEGRAELKKLARPVSG